MKAGTLIVVGLGALFLFNLVNLGVAGNVLQYYIASIDLTGITSGKIVIMIQNPSNAQITVNSMAGSVMANGQTIGNISNFTGGTTIPPNEQKPITVTVLLSLIGLASDIFTALTQPNGLTKIDFVLTGNANINGGEIIPFNITQTLQV